MQRGVVVYPGAAFGLNRAEWGCRVAVERFSWVMETMKRMKS
jgi:hypothetical protein